MTFAVGIFDLFTYAIPGALQLTFLTYVAARLNWLNLDALLQAPAGLLVAGVALFSYVLGHVTYALGIALDRVVPKWPGRNDAGARATFTDRVPAARDRPFLSADLNLLFAAAELHNREAAAEIVRLRAVGLMIRNCAIPMAAGAVVALVEAVAGAADRAPAGCAAVLLLLTAAAAVDQGQRLRKWGTIKTLELAFWIPDIDEKVRPPATREP